MTLLCNNQRCLKYLWVVGLVLLFACPENVSCDFTAEDITVQWIHIKDLDAVLRDQNPVIVDLRTPREFEGGHLAGAVNIPIEDLIRRQSLLDDYRDKPVLLYCRTVNKTRRAIWHLQERGFKSIYALWGGYERLKIHERGAEIPQ